MAGLSIDDCDGTACGGEVRFYLKFLVVFDDFFKVYFQRSKANIESAYYVKIKECSKFRDFDTNCTKIPDAEN